MGIASSPYFTPMVKTDLKTGEVRTASVHVNQVSDFQADGWLLHPSAARKVILPKLSEKQGRKAEKRGLEPLSDQALRDLASKDPGVREALALNAAVEAARNTDREKTNVQESRSRTER